MYPYTLSCAITAEDKAEKRILRLFCYAVPEFIEEGLAQVLIDEHLCEWTSRQGWHDHSMPVFTSDDVGVADLIKAGVKAQPMTLTDVPGPVLKALIAVRKKMPNVTMVTYSVCGKWYFSDDDFKPPAVGPDDGFTELVPLLEDAADHVDKTTGFPAVYRLPRWACDRIQELNVD